MLDGLSVTPSVQMVLCWWQKLYELVRYEQSGMDLSKVAMAPQPLHLRHRAKFLTKFKE